jgi:membrane-associated phospholipid phosphatase
MIRIAFIFLFAMITFHTNAQNADVRFLKACNATDMPVWDKTMEGVSFSVYPAMPASVIGIWSYGYYKKDQEMMRNGYKGALTIGLANGVSILLKSTIRRDRPFVTYPNDIIKRTHAGPLSFPSGHTTAAFATATALSLSAKNWQVAVPSYLYAGLVGYSRMRLGVHYPSDVLAGALIGIGSGFLVWQVDKLIRK